ncbi:hypothetical protein EWF69_17930 [Salmonella enterica subsp. enterica serovar Thompson]|nr:hypothetical protein [Salmonella enterica subsp. enterica serovar Thompson]EBW7959329.1 hypothetical protein [Salmonella enterica subsp. enterica serovar Thompson]ECD1771517.1 hypothetical protein [Salmonella enterica subsp. enterica serovar Thompson]
MKTQPAFAVTAPDFTFELNQLVDIRISEECGEVKGRAQYASGENQYLIHYQAADRCARSTWFGESELEAVYDDAYPGCPVFAAVKLPEGETVKQ